MNLVAGVLFVIFVFIFECWSFAEGERGADIKLADSEHPKPHQHTPSDGRPLHSEPATEEKNLPAESNRVIASGRDVASPVPTAASASLQEGPLARPVPSSVSAPAGPSHRDWSYTTPAGDRVSVTYSTDGKSYTVTEEGPNIGKKVKTYQIYGERHP